ncbi:hypothetical protein KIH74_04585 [Kineosporia sp. J2-2]|uniref:Transcription regulator HTH AraC- type ligand binding domain-containing protein n=1 Tax=Kineosporia corallincola TaxID=2835133 RepID=A0ABS5TAX6_9ACTN|nr:hypothetical protein [Kineosporia corallincola]MBT0768186.1 hypothetical protein [Kineosporia corallincola]
MDDEKPLRPDAVRNRAVVSPLFAERGVVDTTEYDAFGPWIDEVTSPEGLPRLYRAHPLDFSQTLLVLKVPRDIARRDATPAMHLYDALIVVTAGDLTVLTREGEGFSTFTCPHEQIFALDDSVLLLDGRLTVHLTDRVPLTIPYNGSARTSITRLVALLRRAVTAATDTPWAHDGTDGADSRIAPSATHLLSAQRDHGLRADTQETLRTDPDSRVLGGHPSTQVSPRPGSLAALAHRLRPAFLNAGVVLARPGELSLVRRRDWLVRGHEQDLSHARTFLFPHRLDRVEVTGHRLYQGVSVMRLSAGSSALDLLMPENSPTRDVLGDATAIHV